MHLFLINPGNAAANPYLGGQHINDYSSLIWTERFRDYGEFQLTIPRDAASATTIFWPGKLLGIQESNQVMLAETQKEVVNDQGYVEVTVTGRSADCIVEDRVLWAPTDVALTLARQYSDLDAALLYIWGATQNATTNDVGYTVARPPVISTNSKISNSIVTDSVYKGTPFTLQKIAVKPGQMGPTIRKYLNESNYGMRCIRPTSSVAGIYSVSVDPVNGTGKGLITKTLMSGTTNLLRFDVYKGIDRTAMPPANGSSVYLSTEAGHLDNVTVGTTYKEFITNTVHAVDNTYIYEGTNPLPAQPDFAVRHRYIDAKSLVEGFTVGDYSTVIAKAKKMYYQSHNNRAILDADLSPGVPVIFGQHYYLGDTVMLDYKTRTRKALVNEYTRVEDSNGSREYPGFVGWDEITAGVLNDW